MEYKISEGVLGALVSILEDFWSDQWHHYQCCEWEERESHGFNQLVALRDYLASIGRIENVDDWLTPEEEDFVARHY